MYYVAVFVSAALSSGSTWREGSDHAIFFGSLFFGVSFALILLIQGWLVRLVRKIVRSDSKRAPVWEFIPTVIASLLILAAIPDRSSEAKFRRFVAHDMPASVRDVRCWHRNTYGGKSWLLSFRIGPADFRRITTRYPYVEETSEKGYELVRLRHLVESDRDFPVPYPTEPMVVRYRYQVSPSDGGMSVSLYTNAEKTLVYVVGGN